jgi:hypothetical protein
MVAAGNSGASCTLQKYRADAREAAMQWEMSTAENSGALCMLQK